MSAVGGWGYQGGHWGTGGILVPTESEEEEGEEKENVVPVATPVRPRRAPVDQVSWQVDDNGVIVLDD